MSRAGIERWEVPPMKPDYITDLQWFDLTTYALKGLTLELIARQRRVTREAVGLSVRAAIKKVRDRRNELRKERYAQKCKECCAPYGDARHLRHRFKEAFSYLPPWRPDGWVWVK
jgi:hypothetical protein